MGANRTTAGGYQLQDELARFCLPEADRDANRKLAWTNSICLLFLIIGLAGARSAANFTEPAPRVEEAVPTIIEPITGVDAPIADMEAEKSFLSPGQRDLLSQVGVPPYVIDIHRNAEHRMAKSLADFADLGHAIDAAFVGGIHRVQRLDREFYHCRLGVIQHGRDSIAHLFAGFIERQPRRRADH